MAVGKGPGFWRFEGIRQECMAFLTWLWWVFEVLLIGHHVFEEAVILQDLDVESSV